MQDAAEVLVVAMTMRDVEGGQGRWGQANSSQLTPVCMCVYVCAEVCVCLCGFTSICVSTPLKQASLSYEHLHTHLHTHYLYRCSAVQEGIGCGADGQWADQTCRSSSCVVRRT